MRFEIGFSVGKLYNGRRSFFGFVRIGQRTYWLQRWDTERVLPKERTVIIHRGAVMTWNMGTH